MSAHQAQHESLEIPQVSVAEAPATTTSSQSSPSALTQEPSSHSEEEEEMDVQFSPPLYKSRRFKGYLTIFLASIVNYNAALLSDDPLDPTSVAASPAQRRYAMAVALLSAIVTGLLVVIHLDRYSPLEKVWRPAFAAESKFETVLIAGLILWWSVATIIQTSVRGIAGDGKEQYNLFYSTWVCCIVSFWIAERKAVDFGYPSFRNFVTGWPYRAPGWIAIFLLDFVTLWWYIDLYNNTKRNASRVPEQLAPIWEDISRIQYQLLLFVSATTLLPSAGFIFMEILRSSDDDQEVEPSVNMALAEASTNLPLQSPANGLAAVRMETSQEQRQPQKKNIEIVLEGLSLLCLSIMWIPSVIVATTPGGFANQVGNAYFCTWATTIFVLETFLWFIHDWRKSVFKALEQKEKEYRKHQQQVLEQTMRKLHAAEANRRVMEEDDEDELVREVALPGVDDADEYKEYDARDTNHGNQSSGDEEEDEGIPDVRIASTQGDGAPLDHEGEEDDAARELRLKASNEQAYFDTLDDILE